MDATPAETQEQTFADLKGVAQTLEATRGVRIRASARMGRHRLNGYLAQRVPSCFLAGSFIKTVSIVQF